MKKWHQRCDSGGKKVDMCSSSLVSSFSDAISSANPRVIDDSRARKLSNDLKRCTYYETCATYGLNVERVFQDGKKPQRRVVRESESSPLGR